MDILFRLFSFSHRTLYPQTILLRTPYLTSKLATMMFVMILGMPLGQLFGFSHQLQVQRNHHFSWKELGECLLWRFKLSACSFSCLANDSLTCCCRVGSGFISQLSSHLLWHPPSLCLSFIVFPSSTQHYPHTIQFFVFQLVYIDQRSFLSLCSGRVPCYTNCRSNTQSKNVVLDHRSGDQSSFNGNRF